MRANLRINACSTEQITYFMYTIITCACPACLQRARLEVALMVPSGLCLNGKPVLHAQNRYYSMYYITALVVFCYSGSSICTTSVCFFCAAACREERNEGPEEFPTMFLRTLAFLNTRRSNHILTFKAPSSKS